MPWARASALHRHLACPASSWLPRWDDRSGRVTPPYLGTHDGALLKPGLAVIRKAGAAEVGTRAHKEKEIGNAYAQLYKGTDPVGRHEVAVSYCCATGVSRVFPLDVPDDRRKALWKAMQCPHSVVGTTDWYGQLDGFLWVDDLKTGWKTPDVITPQTLFYAMVLRDLKRATDKVAVTITHDPRAKNEPRRLFRWATPLMLESFRIDLHEAFRVTTLSTQPRPGDHCGWCPSVAFCPSAVG